MADVIRHHQSVTLTAGTSTSPSSSPGPPIVVAMLPAVEQRAIAVIAAAAAVAVGATAAIGAAANVRLRIILALVVPAIPPPHRSREHPLPPLRDDLPSLLTMTMHVTMHVQKVDATIFVSCMNIHFLLCRIGLAHYLPTCKKWYVSKYWTEGTASKRMKR